MRITDLHIHGIEGFDTGNADQEGVLRIAEIQGLAGVSEIVLSIYSGSVQAMRNQMAAVKGAMERQQEELEQRPGGVEEQRNSNSSGRLSNLSSNPRSPIPDPRLSARILGVHLEGPFLNPVMCGALDPASFLEPLETTFRELTEGFGNIVRIVTVAPERDGSLPLIRRIADAGIAVNMGHSDATYSEAEAGFRAGARGITHLFNAMRAFHHREPGIVGFGLLNDDIYVEVVGDLNHLAGETLQLVFRMKKPGRIIVVSDSVGATRISRRGEPRDEKGKLVGGSKTLPEAAQGLIRKGFAAELVTMAITENPRGYLRPGG